MVNNYYKTGFCIHMKCEQILMVFSFQIKLGTRRRRVKVWYGWIVRAGIHKHKLDPNLIHLIATKGIEIAEQIASTSTYMTV